MSRHYLTMTAGAAMVSAPWTLGLDLAGLAANAGFFFGLGVLSIGAAHAPEGGRIVAGAIGGLLIWAELATGSGGLYGLTGCLLAGAAIINHKPTTTTVTYVNGVPTTKTEHKP